MKGSIPPCVMDKKLAEARHALLNLTGRGTQIVHSALVAAAGRIKHLEMRLGETETMRDRIAIQLLGGILVGKLLHNGLNSLSCIEYAYKLADDVMAFREQGFAGALGETTSPDLPKFAVGDLVSLNYVPGINFTVLEVLGKTTDGLQIYRLNRARDQETEDNLTLVLGTVQTSA